MNSYFFIPGNKLDKVDSINEFGVRIIIDLEDAVKLSERDIILKKLISGNKNFKSHYIRIPLYLRNSNIDTSFLTNLVNAGFKKFVFPKIESENDLDIIISKVSDIDLDVILLVETIHLFLELQNILLKYRMIKGVALGSHDFMSEVGGIHNLKNLEYPRTKILYLARMFQIEAIDIASMELNDEKEFELEILNGFEKGYDAKFFIHPWQLSIKEKIIFYTKKELEWAKKVTTILSNLKNSEEFNPVIIDNQIIEKPHLNKVKKILQYYESK